MWADITISDRTGITGVKPLTAAQLVADFGIRSKCARHTVGVFYRALFLPECEPLAVWQRRFGPVDGHTGGKLDRAAVALASRYGVTTKPLGAPALWFALQTYYAAVVRLLVRRFVSWDLDGLPGGNPFRWCFDSDSQPVRRQLDRLTNLIQAYEVASFATARAEGDLLKALYQDLFPRRVRHRLGEYYTPDWLAQHVLEQVGFSGAAGQRLLDPACGSGTFLVLALRQARAAWGAPESGKPKAESGGTSACGFRRSHPSLPVVGCDINPLAVLTARANYVIALHDILPRDRRVEIPVYLADSILGRPPGPEFAEPFDFVVGNPPWIAWDNLPAEYRRVSQPLWQQYGLFSLSGNEARHGGGKKDLSMLMLYASADRYLRTGGRLGMVVTQTLFQTKGAGDGFRRFQLGPDGERLKVWRVDEMTALRPFTDAANWTSTIVLEKGAATQYPVPYFVWEPAEAAKKRSPKAMDLAKAREPVPAACQRACLARPIDPSRISSPWLIQPGDANPALTMEGGPSDYTAHLGANSGGANGVYWLEVLGEADGGVLVRNLAAKGKHEVEAIQQVIEPGLLYPLVRWSDVKRYSAVPTCHILLVQDATSRTGIEEAALRERYPRTLAYLERFHDLLAGRAAYRRYQQSGPFYSMYNVGPYTQAPIKVVWRRMDRRINAAVVETVAVEPFLPPRPVVPQETCVLVECASSDEAHYLCALLNSEAINQRVAAHSVRNGKGFGTPGMLQFLGLRRFDPDNPAHQALAAQSRRAHTELSAHGRVAP